MKRRKKALRIIHMIERTNPECTVGAARRGFAPRYTLTTIVQVLLPYRTADGIRRCKFNELVARAQEAPTLAEVLAVLTTADETYNQAIRDTFGNIDPRNITATVRLTHATNGKPRHSDCRIFTEFMLKQCCATA